MQERMDSTPPSDAPRQMEHRDERTRWLFAVLFTLTIAAQLVSLAFGRADDARKLQSIVLPSVLYLSVITIPSIWVGLSLGPRVGLRTSLFRALLSGQPGTVRNLARHAGPACLLGIALGGILLFIRQLTEPYLPPEIPAYGHRGVIGGLSVSLGAAVAEEVWFRLGLMTFLVWCGMRMFSGRLSQSAVIWFVIGFTSVAFGVAHLPQLLSHGAGSPFAIGGTVLGNTAVGMLYGWCFWRKSLFAAMVAHFSVDVVIHVLPAFW